MSTVTAASTMASRTRLIGGRAQEVLTRLADEEMRTVTVTRGDRWAIGMDDREYELAGNLNGQRFQDVYAVDRYGSLRR